WTAVPFEIAPEIRAAWDATTQGAARHTDWRRRFAAYAAAHPELAAEFERRVCRRELPAHWQDSVGRMLAAAVSQAAAIAVRMSALMRQRVIYVFTHDSIGLGEDGPTHQPVEHAASLRLIPNNAVWRPSDAVETVCAWQAAIERRDGPTCLLLSRQNLPHFVRSVQQLDDIRRGGYVLAGGDGPAAITLLATGSEVDLAMRAR